jgi:hypothetical protein
MAMPPFPQNPATPNYDAANHGVWLDASLPAPGQGKRSSHESFAALIDHVVSLYSGAGTHKNRLRAWRAKLRERCCLNDLSQRLGTRDEADRMKMEATLATSSHVRLEFVQ